MQPAFQALIVVAMNGFEHCSAVGIAGSQSCQALSHIFGLPDFIFVPAFNKVHVASLLPAQPE